MKALFCVEKDRCTLGGRPFDLISGSLHYFRIHPSDWERRLRLAKDFGLTAVQTYVPWNAHEPERGQFCFRDRLNLAAFLETADHVGLKVMLRPSPYICSEWDFGGLPWWLLRDHPRIALRCCDPDFMDALEHWYQRLCGEVVPYLSTNGGPVILTAIENEYGSYGTDKNYLSAIAALLRKYGIDVPFYTTDGAGDLFLKYGAADGIWTAVNYRIESEQAISFLRKYQPDRMPLIGEYWSGRAIHWGEEFHPRDIPPIAKAFRKGLDLGACMTFYMFAGGTNFGFYNGANYFPAASSQKGDSLGWYYNPITTSYDVDALLNEGGAPTAKYYACRQELDSFLGKPVRNACDISPDLLEKTQKISGIHMTESVPLAAVTKKLIRHQKTSARPLTMEEMDEGFGFILYSAVLPGGRTETQETLFLDGLHDRAQVYLNRTFTGVLYRNSCAAGLPLTIPKEGAQLDILVENMGRINFGAELGESKGITEQVRLGQRILTGFTMRTLPLDPLPVLSFQKREAEALSAGHPVFYRGTFDAKEGFDTWLHTEYWNKGIAWINGTCIGRYWNVGPQLALYVPGALLRDKENEVIFLELYQAPDTFSFDAIDHPLLDGRILPTDEEIPHQ